MIIKVAIGNHIILPLIHLNFKIQHMLCTLHRKLVFGI